jgi:hypothetical protein
MLPLGVGAAVEGVGEGQPAKRGWRLVHGVAFVGRHSTMIEKKNAESDSV